MLEAKLNGSADSELGYGQLFATLMRRRLLLLGVLLSTMAVSTLLSARKDATYRSSMQLLVESNYEQKANLRGAVPETLFTAPAAVEIDYATQIRLMQSPILLGRAVEALRSEYPDLGLEDLKRGLAVSRVLETEDKIETKILQVDYTSGDPLKSQRVLEVMKNVYLAYNLEQQKLRLSNGLSFIDEQLPTVRQEVANAERSLEDFREGQGIIDPEQQATEFAKALNAIAEQRRAIQAEFQDNQMRFRDLQQQLARTPQGAIVASRLSQSQRFRNLLTSLQETELALAEQLVTYTDRSPTVRSLTQQLDRERALLQQEARRILGDRTELSEDKLYTEAQMGEVEMGLAGQLVATQTNLVGLQARDQSLAQAEAQLRNELNQFPQLIAEYNRLQPDITTKRETLQQLLKARQELAIEIGRGGYNWQVVEAPEQGIKTGPRVLTDLLLGTVLGLFLGAMAVFLRESMDDVIHSPEKLTETVALPPLGMVPRLPRSIVGQRWPLGGQLPLSGRSPAALPMLQAAQWPLFRESMDLVYKSLRRSSPASALRSLAITSALANEGKTLVSIGLALSAARLHQRVLLIDANLRSPSLHHQLNLPNRQGLSTLLSGEDRQPLLHSIGANTDVLTAGPLSSDPVRLLSSDELRDWIRAFEKDYDLVILDSCAVLGVVDAIQTASLCEGVAVVARLDSVSQSSLIQAATALNGLNVIGMIANDVKGAQVAYGRPSGLGALFAESVSNRETAESAGRDAA
ncbi:polysaccharide biosynthesis tyrosine autokinase [Thermoleptolyngbya oregonensis NK1-22]|uniref:Polysaccharide biosynthesis tyrosine autokinase n=1 Tax=Thermoleptolyngbya oregonensis NK1-22 TaxID=2547457 RepID=A0AA96Y1P7_9CYAN|nr:polysaccharide biosynthesis tyrosine autokinase [Thermoleptolyngbya oregonensis]WOB41880.1 polysaccharide biosynthesis tyrosine autokinase [Thermoleptolyngbya oregonensis NK1-22]